MMMMMMVMMMMTTTTMMMMMVMMMMMRCLSWLRFQAKPRHLPYIYIYTHINVFFCSGNSSSLGGLDFEK